MHIILLYLSSYPYRLKNVIVIIFSGGKEPSKARLARATAALLQSWRAGPFILNLREGLFNGTVVLLGG